MIAPRPVPERYRSWNRLHGAPRGRPPGRLDSLLLWLPETVGLRRRGAFGFQQNCSLREFEYPFAHEALAVQPGMRVLEVGGALSGLQFVLSGEGCRVVQVDPGVVPSECVAWATDLERIDTLNRALGTSVELRRCTVPEAGLEPGSFDRAVSISVFEHLEASAAAAAVREVHAALRPGGMFVVTLDLFLDLVPFTRRERNKFGSNLPLPRILETAPFELVAGRREELFGFPEFDPEAIQSRLGEFLLAREWPVMAQCLVLRKPG